MFTFWHILRVALLAVSVLFVVETTRVDASHQQHHRQQQEQSAVLPPRACLPPHHDGYPFCDPSLPLEKRIQDLISRLTLEEKPSLLTARYSPLGSIPRLGIPEYNWGANCMHGVQSRCAPLRQQHGNSTTKTGGECPTSFPNANALGCTFNKTLWNAMGRVIGIELRSLWLQSVGENTPSGTPHLGLDCWSPNVNLQRDPRWGRNLESPGEDPYLNGMYGVEYTRGLQYNSQIDGRFLQAVATLKHFTANSVEGYSWTDDGQWVPTSSKHDKQHRISRHNINTKISMYDMATTYLPAFAKTVQEGGAAGIMCSFNRINGVPSCANEWLLKQVVRGQWNFSGYITSDTGGLDDIQLQHHYTSDWNSTVAVAIQAGCDVESAIWKANGGKNNSGIYIKYLPTAVRLGFVRESDVDRALAHALAIRFRLGLFDPIADQPFWNIPPEVVHSPPHVQLSKEATAQGFVLLKNDNSVLPLNPSSKLALIGPHVHDRSVMLGNYLGEVCRNDRSNGCVTSFYEGFANVTQSSSGTLLCAQGCAVSGTNTSGFIEAFKMASDAETVVFLGGLDLRWESEDRDRPNIRLPDIQVDLIQKLSKINPRIVLILMHGGMVGLDDVLDHVEAIVSIGYPGPYAGEVLPRALFGLEQRAWGKLTMTWYRNSITEDLNMLDFEMTRSPGRTYRYYRGNPHFRFGSGLNPLTTFTLQDVALEATNCFEGSGSEGSCGRAVLSVLVTNTGRKEADEVTIAYFAPLDIPEAEPAWQLREQVFGFERIHLNSGESTKVSFSIQGNETFQLADASGNLVTFPGRYQLVVSNGLDWVEKTIEIHGHNNIIRWVKLENDIVHSQATA